MEMIIDGRRFDPEWGLNDWLYANFGIFCDDLTDDDYDAAYLEFMGVRAESGVQG